jgi:hypothetical protein
MNQMCNQNYRYLVFGVIVAVVLKLTQKQMQHTEIFQYAVIGTVTVYLLDSLRNKSNKSEEHYGDVAQSQEQASAVVPASAEESAVKPANVPIVTPPSPVQVSAPTEETNIVGVPDDMLFDREEGSSLQDAFQPLLPENGEFRAMEEMVKRATDVDPNVADGFLPGWEGDTFTSLEGGVEGKQDNVYQQLVDSKIRNMEEQ